VANESENTYNGSIEQILTEKLNVAQLLMKVSAVYGNRGFITVLKTVLFRKKFCYVKRSWRQLRKVLRH
jgi:hypothetical protein